MRLIIGGRAQGKLQYATEVLGIEPGMIVNDFASVIRQYLLEDKALQPLLDELIAGDKTVICDEVGCGIVPVDEFSRRWRDEVGQACQQLARGATKVERLYCGIPTVLKGE